MHGPTSFRPLPHLEARGAAQFLVLAMAVPSTRPAPPHAPAAHRGTIALGFGVLCFLVLNVVEDTDGRREAWSGGEAYDASSSSSSASDPVLSPGKSAFDIVASAAAAPRTQVVNLKMRADANSEEEEEEDEDSAAGLGSDSSPGGVIDGAVSGSGGRMPPPAVPMSDRERLSVLARARPEDVRLEPYPHLVLRDALHPETYAQLAATYPKYKEVLKVSKGGRRVDPNTRVDIRASMVASGAADKVLTPLWKEFVAYHTSRAFYVEVLDLFEVRRRPSGRATRERPRSDQRAAVTRSVSSGIERVARLETDRDGVRARAALRRGCHSRASRVPGARPRRREKSPARPEDRREAHPCCRGGEVRRRDGRPDRGQHPGRRQTLPRPRAARG